MIKGRHRIGFLRRKEHCDNCGHFNDLHEDIFTHTHREPVKRICKVCNQNCLWVVGIG
jgi:hypothetical protein